MGLKKNVFQNYINFRGLNTKKKLISIQSDDWGSIRIPNKEVYNKLEKKLNLDKCNYSKYDSLETANDIHDLVEVLDYIKSKYGKKPLMTLNYLSCNPDFKRIMEDDFKVYHAEQISTTYKNYDGADNALKYIINDYQSYFDPQFHGREHFNSNIWLKLLNQDKRVRLAFDYEFFALGYNNFKDIKYPYLASFMKLTPTESFDKIIEEGLAIHAKLFKKSATSFIAPVYVWDEKIEESLAGQGINTIQGLYKRKDFNKEQKKVTYSSRRSEKFTSYNQLQTVRNCFFEPSVKIEYDWVNECLKDIEVAFKWNRPAVICSHRINFSGRLDNQRKNDNLKLFKTLLESIATKWPDIEFVDSETLYDEFR